MTLYLADLVTIVFVLGFAAGALVTRAFLN